MNQQEKGKILKSIMSSLGFWLIKTSHTVLEYIGSFFSSSSSSKQIHQSGVENKMPKEV